MQSRSENNIRGIDVSMHQGNINFTKVKESGVKVVYIKATEGVGYVDPMFERNYKDAKNSGMKIGFYHFFTPLSVEDTLNEVEAFLNATKDKQADCKYMLDVEDDRGLDQKTLSNLVDLFLSEMVKNRKQVVLYTYTNFAQTKLMNSLEKYPLWIANYGVTKPLENNIWNYWIGFQYSSTGRVSGIDGNVDLNEFLDDIYIKKSDVDGKVLSIQKQLNKVKVKDSNNESLDQDGVMGKCTNSAIVNFEKIMGLKVDGIWGNECEKVYENIIKKSTIRYEAEYSQISRYVQYRINTKIDGYFGINSVVAMKKWQKNNNLIADGICGRKTWDKLIEG